VDICVYCLFLPMVIVVLVTVVVAGAAALTANGIVF